MSRLELPTPISGGVMLSYRCTARCRHCMYACSPQWEDCIREDQLDHLLCQLAGKIAPSPYGPESVTLNHGLHFSGGEPFLNFDLLLKGVEMAEELGIPSTFVETNCYWCMSDEETRGKLELLKAKGMKGIMISVNPYYLEFVPFERTERCVRIAEEVFPDKAMIYQWSYYRTFQQLGIRGKLPLDDYLQRVHQEDLSKNVELFLMGRAAYSLRHLYLTYPAEQLLRQPCQPPPLRNWHHHFDNYGNWMPGYCGGLSLGDWHDLNLLLDAGADPEAHPVLGFILTDNFAGLLRFANEKGYAMSPEGYVSKCHLCVDLRKHLSELDQFEELTPRTFYAQLEEPAL